MKKKAQYYFIYAYIFTILIVSQFSCTNDTPHNNSSLNEISHPILPQPIHTDIILINNQQRSALYHAESSLFSNSKLIQSEAALSTLNSRATLMLNISEKGRPYADDIEKLAREALKSSNSREKLLGLVAIGAVTIYALTESADNDIRNKTTFAKEFNQSSPINWGNINSLIEKNNAALNLNLNNAPSPQEPSQATPSYGVTLINKSKSTINAVVRYCNTDGKWVTEGWWEIKSGRSIETGIRAIGRTIYYHADDENGYEWGDEYEFYVCRDVFKFKGNYHTSNSYTTRFFEDDTGEAYENVSFTFHE